ncbi:nucleotide sugar dehydrogenase [Erysipelothrix rhusiopathiae]|uniref:Nucleotide sugar dehydrogenase n=1 Tax=Erysipelothrix rhusiopathiae TaxID=1648 RepID=A0A6S6I299_ERYRH|nr:nucleotide sugar dehydrogenase [Erysipelothrix rhusiopathiae]BCB22657.1 nucleotide sugar dehydrogenase [Erysipelothrix rhusiopathiae]
MISIDTFNNKKAKIAVIGLGYVGLPLAISFAKKFDVVGFDTSTEKINKYKKGIDVTDEVGDDEIVNSTMVFTDNVSELEDVHFFVIAVPTPINEDKTPNLNLVVSATETVAPFLKKGAVVVYESTVYPGVTEDICLPILKKISKLNYPQDFSIGYSPERINPGDKLHRLENIVKVVSADNSESLQLVSEIYGEIIEAGVYKAKSIKVAEAAKVIENSQRDINIAFVNELAMIFDKLNINTTDVLEAASTKWNFLNFTPGLVGGHCIGVDPYYLTYRANQVGYVSQIITAGRTVNDDMGKYIAQKTIKMMINDRKSLYDSKVAILGFTFKENCADIRNTRVIDIVKELNDFGVNVDVYDPLADITEVKSYYGLEVVNNLPLEGNNKYDVIILAVNHSEFISIPTESFNKILNDNAIIIDVKNVKTDLAESYKYWSL